MLANTRALVNLGVVVQDIFQLTHRAAKEDEEEVAKQAIEFWCTVAEEEIELQQVRPGTPESTCRQEETI